MKDLIDERNKREKMQNSIIKWWNVNMVPVEEKKDAFAGLSSEEKEAAKQIIARLDAEAKEVEAELKKQEEKEATFNASTGSYSGEYGTKPVDDEAAKEQIEKILKEKEEALHKSIEITQSGMG